MAVLGLVTHPANMVMTMVPRVVAASAGFDRIQNYLLRPAQQNTRGTLLGSTRGEESLHRERHKEAASRALAIRIQSVQICKQNQAILDDININIVAGSFNIVSGATGSGKSMLLRAILGEKPVSKGTIEIESRLRRVSYCSQKPWLPSGTLREAIWGPMHSPSSINQEDEEWYLEITHLCCLEHDFLSLPLGDQTQIGSQGLNLSGGQRQRVV